MQQIIFQPLQLKLAKAKGIEAETTQKEFAAPKRTKSKVLLTKKEKHKIEKKKASKNKKENGLRAYGMETEGGSSLRKFLENPIRFLFGNPQLTFEEFEKKQEPEAKPAVKQAPGPVETAGQLPRDKLAAELRRQADEIDRAILSEIQSYKPMGQMSELAQALRLEPKKGEPVSTPFGTIVFAKARSPDKRKAASWEEKHKKSDELRGKALQYSFSLVPKPHITTGNYRVVEQGKRLREQGLLTPEEIRELEKLEKFWNVHPELDRQKDVGMWNEKLELVPWKSRIDTGKQEVKPKPVISKPGKEEYRRPEYQLEKWTVIYAPHLSQWSLNYYVKGFSSWWQKDFKTFDELRDFLKEGESELYVHGVRGYDKVKWTPITLTEPKLLDKIGSTRREGYTSYNLVQPIYRSEDNRWVWRANSTDLSTGDSKPGEADESDLLKLKDLTEGQLAEIRIERDLKKYYQQDYSNAEVGILWFVPDLVRDLLQDVQKLPKDKTEHYVKLLEDMKERAIAERERREKAEKEKKNDRDKEFKPDAGLINKQLADRSHMGTSWDPEKRAEQEIEGFVQDVQTIFDRLKPYAKTEAQKALLIEEMQRFQTGYAQKYNEKLAAHGRTISSFITGASKFPTRRAEKANFSYEKKWQDMIEWKDRAEKAIIRKLKGEAIEEAGGEIPLLEKKLKDLEKLQEMMVEANKIIRKKHEPGIGGVSKHQQLVNLGFSEKQASELLVEDFAGRKGFTYHLQNNNQEIHRLRDRIAQLQRKEVTQTREFTFSGGHILDNQEDDRVQIFFDQKPSQDIISKLKGEGWHWSPSIGAWQRKRTEYALMSANRITGAQAETQFGVKEVLQNPRDVIGDPPNAIMKMQLEHLWKDLLGAVDIGDFETFMKESSDLTYEEAKEKLLRTYGTPERLRVKLAKDIEESFHVQMCDSAAEDCGKGDTEACRVACECDPLDSESCIKAIEPLLKKFASAKGNYKELSPDEKSMVDELVDLEFRRLRESFPDKKEDFGGWIWHGNKNLSPQTFKESLRDSLLTGKNIHDITDEIIKDTGATMGIEPVEVKVIPKPTIIVKGEPKPMPEDEYHAFGTKVLVSAGDDPELEPAFRGTIIRTLNDGKLIEVRPDGQTVGSFRIDANRVIVDRLPEPEKKPLSSWRKFPDHKSETKAVKEALKNAGIEAEVGHGRGTSWGWLDINIGDPRTRGGLKQPPFEHQYTDEELALQDKVLKITQEVTGRHGDYDGKISILAQEWIHKHKLEVVKPVVEVKPKQAPVAIVHRLEASKPVDIKPVVHPAKSVQPVQHEQNRKLAQKLADITGMPVALPSVQKPIQKPRKASRKAVQPMTQAKPSTVIKKIPKSGIVKLTDEEMQGTIILKW